MAANFYVTGKFQQPVGRTGARRRRFTIHCTSYILLFNLSFKAVKSSITVIYCLIYENTYKIKMEYCYQALFLT